MSHLLTCTDISKSFGPRPLFEGISLSIHEGERIGLIGPNGAGKSTFLKIIANVDTPDQGTITARRQLRVAYVPQSEEFEPGKTIEEVLASHFPASPEEQHARIGEVRSIVGFSGENVDVETLSGGWRKRLAIATRLLLEPDLLLLDEPTNHLDIAGIEWLERFVQNAPFAVIVISHDRVFLENTSSRIIEINRRYPQGFLSIDGNYSRFLEKREEMLEQLDRQEQSLANRVRREVEWLRRGPKARATKANARIQQAEELSSELSAARSRSRLTGTAGVDFTATGRQTKELVTAERITKAFGENEVISDFSLLIVRGMKLGIVGPNGSGKSTILKLLTGELAPDSGEVRRAPHLKMVTFDQQREALKSSTSLRRFLAPDGDSVPFQGEMVHVASYAKRFLFQHQQLETPVSSLSGGEQARLLIARLMLQPADLLLLDEPTNDLDIDTLEVLEENLIEFTGAVVIITHDRMMSESVCSKFYSMDTGEFFASHEQAARAKRKEKDAKNPAKVPLLEKKLAPPAARPPLPVKLSQKERRELESMEKNIEVAEMDFARCEKEVAETPAGKELVLACERLAAAKSKVDKLYERWEKLEQLTKANQ